MLEQPETIEAKTGDAHGETLSHVSPMRVLIIVWGMLLALTVITVVAAGIDLGGSLNLWVAMAIATAKATVVALYFMHLRYERAFLAVVFLGALMFVMLLVSLTLMDTLQYAPALIPGYAPGMKQ